MTPLSIRIPVAALILSIGAAGCSSHHESIRTTPEPTTAAQSQQAAIAKAHADSLRHPYVQADVDFMTGMIGHHAQAIVMAGWAPTHGASPSVRILCERIINAQQDEINTMQTWLRDRQPARAAATRGMRMKMTGMEHDDADAGHADRRADEAAGRRAGRRFRPALPHLHDPAPSRRRDDGQGVVRHATAPARTRRFSSLPRTSTSIRRPK